MKNLIPVLTIAMAAAAVIAASPGTVYAQDDFCMAGPRNVPGLWGVPKWTDEDTTTTSPVSTLLNDPRWTNAIRTHHHNLPLTDDASFRLLYDSNGHYMLVSFETHGDLPSLGDGIYFSYSYNQIGYATKIAIPTDFTSPDYTGYGWEMKLIDDAFVYTNATMQTDGSWSDWWDTETTKPAWLSAAAVWKNEDQSTWGVNFKVNLNGGESFSAIPVESPLQIFLGTLIAKEGGGTVSGFTPAEGPNPVLDGMVPQDPSDWLTTLPLGSQCTGIKLESAKIGVDNGGAAPGNSLTFSPGTQHTLIAIPTSESTIPAGAVAAKFRMANWGTQATQSAWHEIIPAVPGSSGSPSEVLFDGEKFELTCQADSNSPENRICSLYWDELNKYDNDTKTHQCLLVEMISKNPSLQFSNASVYRNMDFETASVIERTASVDVSGLTALYGAAATRDVYLYVEKRNMPEYGWDSMELDREEMFQVKNQVYGIPECSNERETCVEGRCALQCYEGSCPCYKEQFWVDDQCWCAYPVDDEGAETCILQSDDEIQPDVSDEEKLASVWPYIKVRAYWDSGETQLINGVSHKKLVPMVPFSMFIDHAGDYYGFTNFLEGMGNIDVITIDDEKGIYMLTLPNEGNTQLNFTVAAEETSMATEWDEFGFYATGDIVTHNGGSWRCLQSHQCYGDLNWAPGLAHSLWVQI